MPTKRHKNEPAPARDYKDWLLERLKNPERAASYVNAAIEDGSPEMLLLALRDVAEAHKMSKVAKGTGVAREAIYRILSAKGNPRLTSLLNLLGTLRLSITVHPRSVLTGATRRRRRPVAARARRASTEKRSHSSASSMQMRLSFDSSVGTSNVKTTRTYVDTNVVYAGLATKWTRTRMDSGSSCGGQTQEIPPAFVIHNVVNGGDYVARQ